MVGSTEHEADLSRLSTAQIKSMWDFALRRTYSPFTLKLNVYITHEIMKGYQFIKSSNQTHSVITVLENILN
jgi:hypothetical protein